MNLNSIANTLDLAQLNQSAVEQISKSQQISLEDAYAIQAILVGKRLIRGNSYKGVKMGFTSREKMEQMGVSELIWGLLTSEMEYKNNGEIELSRFIHPRIEPEIAFLLSKDIDQNFSNENMKDYVESVSSALEIIDSRYQNFKFSLEDVIADNCSSAGYILGEWEDKNIDLTSIKMDLLEDGVAIQEGNSNNILGNPWESFQESVRIAAKYGHSHKKGHIILAGAATAAHYMKKGSTYEWRGSALSSIKVKAV